MRSNIESIRAPIALVASFVYKIYFSNRASVEMRFALEKEDQKHDIRTSSNLKLKIMKGQAVAVLAGSETNLRRNFRTRVLVVSAIVQI